VKLHIAKKGETIDGLAHQYQIAVEKMLEANPGLSRSERLNPGQKVKIPVSRKTRLQLHRLDHEAAPKKKAKEEKSAESDVQQEEWEEDLFKQFQTDSQAVGSFYDLPKIPELAEAEEYAEDNSEEDFAVLEEEETDNDAGEIKGDGEEESAYWNGSIPRDSDYSPYYDFNYSMPGTNPASPGYPSPPQSYPGEYNNMNAPYPFAHYPQNMFAYPLPYPEHYPPQPAYAYPQQPQAFLPYAAPEPSGEEPDETDKKQKKTRPKHKAEHKKDSAKKINPKKQPTVRSYEKENLPWINF